MAVKLTGEPVAPLEVAVTVLVVAKLGRVTVVEAIPSAPVEEPVGFTLPPAGVIAQAIACPETGLPARVATTRSGLGSVVPIPPDCPSPLGVAMAIVTAAGGGGGGVGGLVVPPPPHAAPIPLIPASTSAVSRERRMLPPLCPPARSRRRGLILTQNL